MSDTSYFFEMDRPVLSSCATEIDSFWLEHWNETARLQLSSYYCVTVTDMSWGAEHWIETVLPGALVR